MIPSRVFNRSRGVEDEPSRQALAVRIAEQTAPEERAQLSAWLDSLLAIRGSNESVLTKTKRAIQATMSRRVIWPAVKIMAQEVKRLGWDDRSASARWGLGGAAVGAALFGGKAAGIAALGTAIGVPLWVVFGAGAAFAKSLHSELTRKSATPPTEKPGKVIDAIKGDDGIHRV